jgi:hypothetical protein
MTLARKKIRTPEERRASEERAEVIDEYLAKLELRIGEETVPFARTTWDERTKMIDDYIAKLRRQN